MADFKIIETQEQLDSILHERLQRKEAQIRKEYEGFLSAEEVTSKFAELTKQAEDLQNALTDANSKISAHTEELKARDNKIAEYERDALKIRICRENGLPFDAVNFLGGTDEKTITESATALKSMLTTNAMPLAQTEKPIATNNKDVALKEMLQGLSI